MAVSPGKPSGMFYTHFATSAAVVVLLLALSAHERAEANEHGGRGREAPAPWSLPPPAVAAGRSRTVQTAAVALLHSVRRFPHCQRRRSGGGQAGTRIRRGRDGGKWDFALKPVGQFRSGARHRPAGTVAAKGRRRGRGACEERLAPRPKAKRRVLVGRRSRLYSDCSTPMESAAALSAYRDAWRKLGRAAYSDDRRSVEFLRLSIAGGRHHDRPPERRRTS